ncbi:TetR/AcrR family transcriptional regulator [Konateibacter massiliensis]|uniref:TetR/AcrR family transcriptional regulator n=1 Tax=Konateibacter massiliensis TaxID=2002841 RepID=UPI000C14C0E1|nr:TetR/AcrR family transcriptional regulator [Konateibacter massiliensis]
MKYNLNGKPNRFAQRTLSDFSNALFTLLSKKSFEEITVNELCEISNYPRATFYNYFEDIFDLLNYCWLSLTKEIYTIMENCPCTSKYPIPYELVAEHYSNTILLLIEWCFLKNKCSSKEEAIEHLKYLLNGI